MKTDSALDVVAAYLRVNDYFVLTELELHEWRGGSYQAITDVDVIAVRFPSQSGPAHYGTGKGVVECLLAGEVDPTLDVATDRTDVIIGEVKRGAVSINHALRDPRVLHAVLRRIGDVTGTPIGEVVDDLAEKGEASTASARFRIVAFGIRGSVSDATAMHHDHLVEWLNGVLGRHRDLFEVTNFADPVLSLLALAARINRPLAPSGPDAGPQEESHQP